MPPVNPSEILQSFSLPPAEYKVHEIKQGLINDTFLVRQGSQIRYVLQRINTAVFGDAQALMGNIQKALPMLRASDYQQILLIKTRRGHHYLDAEAQGCWRLMTFIPGSITYNTTNNPQTAFEAGRVLGRFHGLLREADPADFTTVIPGFHSLPLRYTQYKKALESGRPERRAMAAHAINMVNSLMGDPPSLPTEKMTSRLCHNDTKLNNILFSAADGKALCLIDLDTLMEGCFPYDFGDAVRTIVNTAPEDERILSRITFSRPLFNQFIKGLAEEEGLLTREEIQYLPQGAVYMPLLHGIRALTDYLNDDKYYQTTYEGQNLDRSISLFAFAQKARAELDFIGEQTAKHLLPPG